MKEQTQKARNVGMIMISRAEYDAKEAQIAELKSQNEWLIE